MFIKTLIALASALAVTAFSQTTPYTGQQARAIKSLSDSDIAELLAGQGMGLAKAAELNGYPGPAHVLELADALALTPGQRQAAQDLMASHKARARELGSELVVLERNLDQAFLHKTIDPSTLRRLTADIGAKQAALREEHLRTHLSQTALLNTDQVMRYAAARGYTQSPAPSHGQELHSPSVRPHH